MFVGKIIYDGVECAINGKRDDCDYIDLSTSDSSFWGCVYENVIYQTWRKHGYVNGYYGNGDFGDLSLLYYVAFFLFFWLFRIVSF